MMERRDSLDIWPTRKKRGGEEGARGMMRKSKKHLLWYIVKLLRLQKNGR